MRIVVALDIKELSDERTRWDALRAHVRTAAQALAPIASGHQLLIVYAEEAAADGSLGHLIEQELGNLLPFEIPFATLQMMIEIDPNDAARDGPTPLDIFELRPIRWLLERGTVVICAGGGAATVYARGAHRRMIAVDADVDVDRCAELLARKLAADLLLLTGAPVALEGSVRAIRRTSPQALAGLATAPGPLTDKLRLACRFVESTGNSAALGAIRDARRIVAGEAGLTIASRSEVVYAD